MRYAWALVLAWILPWLVTWGQDAPAALAPDLVAITSAVVSREPEAVEWLFTLRAKAGGVAPSLRVTLSYLGDFSANAGAAMAVDAEDQATGTIRVRAAWQDRAAGTCRLTAEIGPAGPTLIGQVVKLRPGQDLDAVASNLNAPASVAYRHMASLGNLAGCQLSAYIMPGRRPVRSVSPALPATAGDPATQSVALFRRWVRGVKTGNLEEFAAGVPSAEWASLTPEQRQQRLKESQEAFTTVLGASFDPERFQTEYKGDATRGTLTVRYEGKELPALQVRFVHGGWALLEP